MNNLGMTRLVRGDVPVFCPIVAERLGVEYKGAETDLYIFNTLSLYPGILIPGHTRRVLKNRYGILTERVLRTFTLPAPKPQPYRPPETMQARTTENCRCIWKPGDEEVQGGPEDKLTEQTGMGPDERTHLG